MASRPYRSMPTFPPALERRFRHEQRQASVPLIQAALGLGVFQILWFAVRDWMVAPDAALRVLPVRLVLMVALVVALWLLARPRATRWVDPTILLFGSLFAFLPAVLLVRNPHHALEITTPSFIILNVGCAMVGPALPVMGWVMAASLAGAVLSIFLAQAPEAMVVHHISYAGSSMVVALLMAWLQEVARRRAFAAGEAERRARAEAEAAVLAEKAARAEAEAAARAKAAFLAMMSHEIRTPMNGVMTMAEILDQTELTPDQKLMTHTVRQSARALLTVINDVLDFSKIEAGRLTIEHEPFDLVGLIEAVADLLAPRAEEKGLAFHLDLAADLPRRVAGDPHRVRQLLLNLAANAVKFTERGHVLVQARMDGGQLRVLVEDTGIGLSEDQIALLFQPFAQADSSTARRFGGTGLGLSICKRLADLMDGDIGVDSTLGQGARFWFAVPLDVIDAAPWAPEETIAAARVALAGYGPLEAAILGRYLAAAGISPPLPVNALLPGQDVDLILVNGRDGLAPGDPLIAAASRHAEALVVVTAPHIAMSTLQASGRAYGLFARKTSLTAPVHMRRLWAVAAAALGLRPLEALARQNEEQPRFQPPALEQARAAGTTVLVAEDNDTNQLVIARVLDRLGFAHRMAPDGFAALELYRQDRFGLLLTDFHMPGMDGFDLTRAIREIEAQTGTPRLPIIALTADAMPGIEERCLDVGMDGYLRKPIEIPLLEATLSRFLPDALALRQPFGNAPQPAPAVVSIGDDGVLDLSRLIRAFGSFDDDAAATLGGFVDGLGAKLAAIERAVDTADLAQVKADAHALKGAARNVGAGVLGMLCADLQRAATRGDEVAVRQTTGLLPEAIVAVRRAAAPWMRRAGTDRTGNRP